MSNIKTIEAKQLKDWLSTGEAILVDVREPNEFSQWHIPQATSMPLTHIDKHLPHLQGESRKIVFQCLKGKRGEMAVQTAENTLVDQQLYNLAGGIEAWQAAKLPIIGTQQRQGTAKLSITRQVLIVAGGLVLLFSLWGLTGATTGILLAATMGAGLLFAGLTGNCAIAKILEKTPWNQ